MDDKRRQKWQAGAHGFLEPGEQVVAAAPGQQGDRMWLIMFLVDAIALPLLQRARGYLVTERHIYLCRLSSLHNRKVEEVLEKRRLGDVRVEFRRNRLTLDGRDPVYVGWLPVGKRWARDVVAAAKANAPDEAPATR